MTSDTDQSDKIGQSGFSSCVVLLPLDIFFGCFSAAIAYLFFARLRWPPLYLAARNWIIERYRRRKLLSRGNNLNGSKNAAPNFRVVFHRRKTKLSGKKWFLLLFFHRRALFFGWLLWNKPKTNKRHIIYLNYCSHLNKMPSARFPVVFAHQKKK